VEDREAYNKARRRAGAKLGFYIHLVVYVVINVMLVAINFATTPQHLWFWWPLMGWGLGVFFHGLAVFAFSENAPMMERMIEKELKAQAKRQQSSDGD
jgi:hypothetical protein